MKKERTHYFSASLYQIMQEKRLYIGVIGVVGVLFFALGRIDFTGSVLYAFQMAMSKAEAMAVFMFCAYPAASSYSEELEGNYIRYAIVRGSLERYVIGKAAVIFVSAMFIMTAGCTLFALLCRIWLPWQDAETLESVLQSGGLRFFLTIGEGQLWFVFYGMQRGIQAGVLALAASWISLYITNRMLVFAAPALIYQMISELSYSFWKDVSMLQFADIYDAGYNILHKDGFSVLWGITLGGLLWAVISFAIYKKVRKRI